MAYKNTTTAPNPPHFIACETVADFATLPTHEQKGTGGMTEKDNDPVPIGSVAQASTGQTKMLFPNGWANA